MSSLQRIFWWVLVCALGVGGVAAFSDDGVELANREAALLAAIDFQGLSNSLGVALLKDPFPEARRLAAKALASDADPERMRLLAEFAGDTDAWTRYHSMVAAGRIGQPGVRIALRGIKDNAPVVRQAAVWAACHGGDEAFDAVTGLLLTEYDQSVLETALANLWRFKDKPWESHAARFASHDKPGLRRAAASSLARSERQTRLAALRQLVADPEPVIRATAVDGFTRGPISSPDVKVIVGALWDGDWRVQAAACGVLAARDDIPISVDAGNAVAELWLSPRGQLAVPALRAAAQHKSVGSDKGLFQLLGTAEPWLATETLLALAQRGSPAAVAVSSEWIDGGEIWQRLAAARAAAGLGGQEGEELERLVVADPDPAVRLAWLESLDSPVASERMAVLWALVKSDPDPMVRAQCTDLLADAGELNERGRSLELYRAWGADDAGDARAAALLAALDHSDETQQRAVIETAMADRNRSVTAMVVNRARQLDLKGTVMSGESRHGR